MRAPRHATEQHLGEEDPRSQAEPTPDERRPLLHPRAACAEGHAGKQHEEFRVVDARDPDRHVPGVSAEGHAEVRWQRLRGRGLYRHPTSGATMGTSEAVQGLQAVARTESLARERESMETSNRREPR